MSQNFLTPFPKNCSFKPTYYIVDGTNKTLGRLSVLVSKLLRSKENPFYTPSINLGNFVIIINANKIIVSGKKKTQKFYFRQNQRPGSLTKKSFNEVQKKNAYRILEKSIWGMLPKGILGRKYYSQLFVYNDENIDLKKGASYQLTLENINFSFI